VSGLPRCGLRKVSRWPVRSLSIETPEVRRGPPLRHTQQAPALPDDLICLSFYRCGGRVSGWSKTQGGPSIPCASPAKRSLCSVFLKLGRTSEHRHTTNLSHLKWLNEGRAIDAPLARDGHRREVAGVVAQRYGRSLYRCQHRVSADLAEAGGEGPRYCR